MAHKQVHQVIDGLYGQGPEERAPEFFNLPKSAYLLKMLY
jgi:hypothetical protein